MRLQSRIDEMVGKHVAGYQLELLCAERMRGVDTRPKLPCGYPPAVYHPRHLCSTPAATHYFAARGGHYSNGVPRVLGAELVDGYPLGAYHHPA